VSTRLQVLVDDQELREIQRIARVQGVTVAEWVRQALRQARRKTPSGAAGKKLDVLRAASRYAYPTADITTMLKEIEGGYSSRAGFRRSVPGA
jgi:RecJ-like exonuclease